MAQHKYALGVLGTGHIAAVIIKRLLDCGYLSGDRIIVSKSRKLAEHPLDVAVADNPSDVVRDSRMVMISVTPQHFAEAAESIREAVAGDHLFLSLMAGVSTQRVAAVLGGQVGGNTSTSPKAHDAGSDPVNCGTDFQSVNCATGFQPVESPSASANSATAVRVIRAMPNLPFGLGRGVTGLFKGAHATRDDLEEVKHFFNAGGVTVEVEREELMDAVTAVAGSGPAYFYYFVEMMMAGGVAAGLKPDDAQVLAAHACVGAGAMLLQKGASPAELRAAVTSPGGTTQAAMDKLRECQVADHVTEAVLAAFRRGQELGQGVAPAGTGQI